MQDFCFRIVVFGAIGLTVSNVAKARARPEGKLLGAIEMINREILNNTDFERIMLSILNTAMEVTNSDLSAAILLDGEGMTRRTFATASSVLMNDAGRLELDDALRTVAALLVPGGTDRDAAPDHEQQKRQPHLYISSLG